MRTNPLPTLTSRQIANFYAKVRDDGDCQVWTGSSDSYGRGRFGIAQKPYLAPRLAYYLHYGVDPVGSVIMHTCDNPSCVNPSHLAAGTQKSNIRDALDKGRVPMGAARCNAVLNEDMVREIKRGFREGIRSSVLAIQFGVARSTISNIKSGLKWSYVQ